MKYFTMLALVFGLGSPIAAMAKDRHKAGCREGQQEMWMVDDGSGEHMNPVLYVCHNGVFQKARGITSYSKETGCKEGEQETWMVDDGSGEHMNPVLYVCHNGVFVRAN